MRAHVAEGGGRLDQQRAVEVGEDLVALARVGVGIGEAGCSPPAHSMIADYYPPEQRSTAMGFYTIGISAGIMLAYLLGGWVVHNVGWREAFRSAWALSSVDMASVRSSPAAGASTAPPTPTPMTGASTRVVRATSSTRPSRKRPVRVPSSPAASTVGNSYSTTPFPAGISNRAQDPGPPDGRGGHPGRRCARWRATDRRRDRGR